MKKVIQTEPPGKAKSRSVKRVLATCVSVLCFGLFHTNAWTDDGRTWSRQAVQSIDGRVTDIAIAEMEGQSGDILAGVYAAGMYKSAIPEFSWTHSNKGLWMWNITSVVVSPSYENDQTVFSGTEKGIYKSTDGAVTWEKTSFEFGVTALAVSPAYLVDQTLFAGTSGGGVVKSMDGGQTWGQANVGLTNGSIQCLAASPDYSSDETLFAGTADGLFKSTDGGSSWHRLGPSSFRADVKSIAISPNYANDTTLLVGVNSLILKSVDGGGSWIISIRLSQRPTTISIAFSPSYAIDSIAFIGVGYTEQSLNVVYYSNNGGDLWSETGWDGELPVFRIVLSPYYSLDRRVFVASWNTIFESRSEGAYWRPIFILDTLRYVRTLSFSPSYILDETIFAGIYNGGVLRSEDGGLNWEPRNTNLASPRINSIQLSPEYAMDGIVFIGTIGRVCRSTDRGNTWTSVLEIQGGSFVSLAISPNYSQDQTIFASIRYSGVFKSEDGGVSWTPVNNGLERMFFKVIAISPSYAADSTLFIGEGDGIYRSIDGGGSWEHVLQTETTVYAIGISPTYYSDGTVFASTMGQGLFRSYDGGNSWEPVNDGLTNTFVKAIGISPAYATDHTVFAGTWGSGVFKSTDGGSFWQDESQDLAGTFVRSLDISPEYPDDQLLLAGTWTGIFRSFNGGQTWQFIPTVRHFEVPSWYIIKTAVFTSGSWDVFKSFYSSGGKLVYSNEAGSYLDFLFEGTEVAWIGTMSKKQGIAKVLVDGVLDAYVNGYSYSPKWQTVLWEKQGLSPGTHVIRIESTGLKDAVAVDSIVTVDAFNVW